MRLLQRPINCVIMVFRRGDVHHTFLSFPLPPPSVRRKRGEVFHIPVPGSIVTGSEGSVVRTYTDTQVECHSQGDCRSQVPVVRGVKGTKQVVSQDYKLEK